MAKIGKNVLENLTQAMYDDSRIIFREYIQNAADQIDIATKNNSFPDEELQITIELDKKKRNIFIVDNANGIPANEIKKRLADIADSDKIQGESKGFRGIGRLGGIGYCKELRFVTSCRGEDVQTTMVWNATELRAIINDTKNHDSAEKVLDKVISYRKNHCGIDEHFFRVEMLGINDENDKLLDEDSVRQYISEVAPVDYIDSFILKPEIERFINEHADEVPPLNIYNIYLRYDNGDLMKVKKNYANGIFKINNGKKIKVDSFNGIQADVIRNDSGNPVAWIWYAISSFKASINEGGNPFRGLRLRQFNILIGNRETLSNDHNFFKEKTRKANHYFIGEVHTIDKNLRPNARRDYFNENNSVRDFEDALQQYISKNLDSLYKDGSRINSGYDKITKLADLQKTVKDKQRKGFASASEKIKLEKELESALGNAEKAIKDITRIEKKSKDEKNSPLSKLVNTVTKERKIDINKVKEKLNRGVAIIQPANDGEKLKVNSNGCKSSENMISPVKKPKLLVDELSCLNKGERKLVSRIYDVIHKNLIFDEADSLIQKIQEELKKNNAS